MRVGLLGPTTLAVAENTAQVGGPRVRALLALLALDAGRAVPVARLIDRIWDEEPPAAAENALQTLVRRLRAIMPADTVKYVQRGYLLTIEPEDVDIHRFGHALETGRRALTAGRPDAAATALDEALHLWRGPAFADIGDIAHLRVIADTVAEQRLDAIELRADAYLTEGRAAEIVRELTVETAANPFRESLAARLITVLATVGRKAEALQVYRRTEATLAAELGVGPSAELRSAVKDLVAPTIEVARPEAVTSRRFAPARSEPVTSRRPAPAHLEPATSRRPAPVRPDPVTPLRPAPAAADRARLPRRFTSFVGREQDLAEVARLLAESPMVTLVGLAGVGKTRLATELVHARGPDWPDGHVFVELAGVGPEQAGMSARAAVGAAVLSALGRVERVDAGGGDWIEVLVHALRGRRMLLILDNCEHVVVAVAELADQLLQRLPALTILATSRESLGIEGERRYPLRTLDLPGSGDTIEAAGNCSAVRLFVDRATTVRPDFGLTQDNCADVATLVRGLDGMPLAIELAAARLQVLSLRAVIDRLDDRFALLTSNSRRIAARHRSLHAAVAWSWALLTEREAELARRISVFGTGATLDMVLATCADHAADASDPMRAVTAAGIVDTLMSLVTKSLVEFDGTRYRMAETIRAYAALERESALAGRPLAQGESGRQEAGDRIRYRAVTPGALL
ncbi:AfsR/SARP family transcriptional regulator [Nocardia sp. NPDC020380]|uniref:AfsR/SARP family transcriptional regulator n=1 Tax=Nocardia sp. NPDC020380 TaxID=3364309 RepID=UPI003797815F